MSLWDRVGREVRDESVAYSEQRGKEDDEEEDGNDAPFIAPIKVFDGEEDQPPARIATSSSSTLGSGGFVIRDCGRWDDKRTRFDRGSRRRTLLVRIRKGGTGEEMPRRARRRGPDTLAAIFQ